MVDRCDPLIDQLPLDLLQSHLEIHHAGRTRLNDLFDLVRMSIDKTGADIPSVRIDFFIILPQIDNILCKNIDNTVIFQHQHFIFQHLGRCDQFTIINSCFHSRPFPRQRRC